MAEKIITLFHGSIFEIDHIDVKRGKPYKDFGAGFYTSKVRTHATDLARRNLQIELKRIQDFELKAEKPQAFLYTYHFHEEQLENLKVKEFANANADWVRFVIQNRKSKVHLHDYDIVIGPTANDQTMPTINAFLAGLFGEINDDEAIATFLRQIEPLRLPSQFYFGTQRAIELLRFIERSAVK
jgi:hypothetical protein